MGTPILLYLFAIVWSVSGNETTINMKLSFDPTKARICTTSCNFKEFLLNSDIFIDKSLFIKFVIEQNMDTTLITFPPGWGKTICLDMVRTFLHPPVDKDGNQIKPFKATENYRLFANGEIMNGTDVVKLKKPFLISREKEVFFDYVGQWPVLFMNLSTIVGTNYMDLEDSIRAMVQSTFKEHKYLIKGLQRLIDSKSTDERKRKELKLDLEDLNAILDGTMNREYGIYWVDYLAQLLYQHFKKDVFILVDGYDDIVNYLRFGPERFTGHDKYIIFRFLKSLMIHTQMCNPHVNKWIVMMSMNFGDATIFPKMDDTISLDIFDKSINLFFGFNQTEAEMLFDAAQIPQNLRYQAQDRYLGYNGNKNGTVKVYNMWDIVNFVNTKTVKDYWIETVYNEDFHLKKLLCINKIRGLLNSIAINGTSDPIRLQNRNFTIVDYRFIQKAENATWDKHNSSILDLLFTRKPYDVLLGTNQTDVRDGFEWSEEDSPDEIHLYTLKAIFKLLNNKGFITLQLQPDAKRSRTYYATFPNKEIEENMKRYLKEFDELFEKY